MTEKQILETKVAELRSTLHEATALLKVCQTQVGTILGEQIDELVSRIEGKKFIKNDWDLTDKNGDQ